MERPEHCRVVPLPLANRSLLQTDQADLAVGGFPGHQRQRRAFAGLDGAPGLFTLAGSGFSIGVGPQLQPPLYHHSCFPLEKMGPVGFAASLWDSRRSLSIPGPTGAGLLSRNRVKLWDSQWTSRLNPASRKSKTPENSQHSVPDEPSDYEGTEQLCAAFNTLWDACGIR